MGIGNQLRAEFKRIEQCHRDALRLRVARAVLGPSVIRVFTQQTKPVLFRSICDLPIDELALIRKSGFSNWYEDQLHQVAAAIRRHNSRNSRVLPGIKWGHAAKVLSLYLRDIVLHTSYFAVRDVRRIEYWLHAPVDGLAIRRLKRLGVNIPFRLIREIDTARKFYMVQDQLQEAAEWAGVPRVWFDDNWADREN